MAAKDKPKKKKVDPIPVIGVRGSSTKISAVKTAGVAGAMSIALIAPSGRTLPAVGAERNLSDSLTVATERAKEIWDKHGTKIIVGGGLIALFGAAFDRRYKDFPVRLGR